MAIASTPHRRTRGEIETLPSGSLRVRVYAGIDPVSKKKHYLVETVPAGPRAAREAEKVRQAAHQVDEKRSPQTKPTANQLIDRTWKFSTSSPRGTPTRGTSATTFG